MIEIVDLKKTYQMGDVEVRALRGVSLTIKEGEFVAIMGPSGSGKSTLLHILGLLDTPDSGSFRLLGQEVSQLDEEELAALRARSIGFIFQQFNLLPRTTALENVALPLLYASHRSDTQHAEELLKEVGLGDRILHKPNELSGGQQQRVAIARSLINSPPIILADEPTGNLDSQSEEEILKILTELNARGKTVIVVTHEGEVGKRAHRILRMRDGLVQSDERLKSSPSPAEGRSTYAPSPLREKKGLWASLNPIETAQHFKQAFRALMANKVRSGLSLLGILIGVSSLIAMLALGEGAKASIETRLASLGTNLLTLRPGARRSGGVALETGAVTRLTLGDAKEIQSTMGAVRRTAPSVSGRGQAVYGGKNWNTSILGTTPAYAEMRAALPVAGRFFTEEENRQRARVAVMGQTVVRELFPDMNPIGENFKINKVNFQVIGILPEKGASTFRDEDDTIVIPLSTAMHRLLGKDYVDSIDVEVSNPEAIEPTQDEIKQLVMDRRRLGPNQEDSFQVRNMAEIQSTLEETSRTMSWLLAAIAAISLLVGGIGIMNIMLVSVTERTREIGLRKAVGAKRSDILMQFLIEAVVVSLTGGGIGVLLGWGATLAMSHFAGWAASVSWEAVALALTFSATVGILFGLWPARKASRLNPIEALRYE